MSPRTALWYDAKYRIYGVTSIMTLAKSSISVHSLALWALWHGSDMCLAHKGTQSDQRVLRKRFEIFTSPRFQLFLKGTSSQYLLGDGKRVRGSFAMEEARHLQSIKGPTSLYLNNTIYTWKTVVTGLGFLPAFLVRVFPLPCIAFLRGREAIVQKNK